uniref:Reverse transcriptase domain-containing protein n=1 Tax=Tanacetum cinerariifolium TaxID=118510 RepID=A0A6L2NI63_TANCI|nr:reverse transcriptase domain-containing protein [Tanacetum cinerariifolium]
MRTRSSSNLPVESPPNPSTFNPKRHNRRRSKQPFILKESPVDTMADQRTMAELLRAPTEGYVEAIVVPSILAEQFKLNDANSSSSFEIAKLTHVVNQQTSDVTTAMTVILKQFQETPPPASVKAVEEICVTCGCAHLYYQCLAAGGNTFSELMDNIQGYVVAVVVNYNQGNSVNRPPVVPLSELEKIKRVNEANMKAIQTQINNVKNELRNEMKNSIQASMSNQTNELKNMMASFFQMNIDSTSGSGSLPSNTIDNPKADLKAITTRSGIVLDGPFVPIPPPFINPDEDERREETLTDQDLAEYTIKKELGLPELIPTRMTLELANRAIYTPAGIAKDVFVLVSKFTFPADFVIVDYESDPRVPLILGRPFLRIAHALIDVHGEEMILYDIFDPDGGNVLIEKLLDLDSTKDPRENLLNINLLIAKTKSLNDNPTPDHVLKPPSPFPIPIEPDQSELTSIVILAEPRVHVPNVLTTYPTLMLDSDFIPSNNSLPEPVIFYFNIEEKNSGSTTIYVDISLSDLECFNFKSKPDPGELTSIVDSGIRENVLSATNVNLPPEEDHSPLFAYVVWIFLSFLTHLVVLLNLLSFGNEDTIFDPGISNYHFLSLLPDVSHRCETFMKFNVYPKLFNESPMEILSSTCSPMDQ